ncbi:MAG: glutamate--tRNA ligase [Candidatus Brocadiia bacterium]
MDSPKIRVRFAPSPTGYMHIGNLRTALYNWLFARHCGGTFILRIEDTDRQRHNEDAIRVIIDGLNNLGLHFDEGPFFQSDRLPIYRRHAEELVAQGLAYKAEAQEGKGEAIILGAPEEEASWVDVVKGLITFQPEDLQELVLIKSDGFPTYNFACVVDDHEMAITHVLRGDDHVSNTPKQICVYRALGWEPPTFGHFPMILGMDGQRLSKRHGAVKVTDFLDAGYLPITVLNFIALLGWSPGGDKEIMSLKEMVELFTIDRVRPTAAKFDYEKFAWMNGVQVRASDPREICAIAMKIITARGFAALVPSQQWLEEIIKLYIERIKTVGEFIDAISYFFVADADLKFKRESIDKVLSKEAAPVALQAAYEALNGLTDFTAPPIEAALRGACEKTGLGLGKIAQPVRVAVTGLTASAELFKTLELLGKDRSMARIVRTLEFFKTPGSFPIEEPPPVAPAVTEEAQ